jgi:ABC-type lipoprotein export system ATPase subunit
VSTNPDAADLFRQPIAVCSDVSRIYGRGGAEVVALLHASCELYRGMHVALTGRSGSGKSTLLHLLAGLDRPTGGEVSWPGLGGAPRDLAAGTIGFVFQSPTLISTLDVVENVSLPLILGGSDPRMAAVKARRALDVLDVGDLAAQLPDQLSGGQAQRVAVARALVSEPVAILADEPTGQLDSTAAASVAEALIDAARHHDSALLVATHDERLARHLELRWLMEDGQLRTHSEAPTC